MQGPGNWPLGEMTSIAGYAVRVLPKACLNDIGQPYLGDTVAAYLNHIVHPYLSYTVAAHLKHIAQAYLGYTVPAYLSYTVTAYLSDAVQAYLAKTVTSHLSDIVPALPKVVLHERAVLVSVLQALVVGDALHALREHRGREAAAHAHEQQTQARQQPAGLLEQQREHDHRGTRDVVEVEHARAAARKEGRKGTGEHRTLELVSVSPQE